MLKIVKKISKLQYFFSFNCSVKFYFIFIICKVLGDFPQIAARRRPAISRKSWRAGPSAARRADNFVSSADGYDLSAIFCIIGPINLTIG